MYVVNFQSIRRHDISIYRQANSAYAVHVHDYSSSDMSVSRLSISRRSQKSNVELADDTLQPQRGGVCFRHSILRQRDSKLIYSRGFLQQRDKDSIRGSSLQNKNTSRRRKSTEHFRSSLLKQACLMRHVQRVFRKKRWYSRFKVRQKYGMASMVYSLQNMRK